MTDRLSFAGRFGFAILACIALTGPVVWGVALWLVARATTN